MSTKQLAVRGTDAGFTVVITPEAEIQKTGALARAAAIKQVTNSAELESAIAIAGILKGIAKEVEKTRKDIKQPFLDAGREIDAKAAEYVRDINRKTAEIEQLASNYQAELQRKTDEARREQERRQREALEAQLKRDEALAAKQKEYEQATAPEKARAMLAMQQAEIDAAEARDTAEETAETVIVEPPKVVGASITPTFTFEVLDIERFAQWDRDRRAAVPNRAIPSFVEMKVKTALFNEYIKTLPDSFNRIPGILISRKIQIAARSVAPSISLPAQVRHDDISYEGSDAE